MSTIAEIEEKLIRTLKDLGIFKRVLSVGREELPKTKVYPSAYVFFVNDRDAGSKARPVAEIFYEVVTAAKSMKSETDAARDAYSLIDSVRDAIQKKTLGMGDIEPFTCVSRDLLDYSSGTMVYAVRFRTRRYLPVVTE